MIIKVYMVHNICIILLVLNNNNNNTIALVLDRYTMLVENIMKVIIIVLLTIKEALFELNSNKNINKRLIANGTEYDASKYPYVVFLTIGQTLCTGSLIHKLYVLTAAHCCYGRDASIFKVSIFMKYLSISNVIDCIRYISQTHKQKNTLNT